MKQIVNFIIEAKQSKKWPTLEELNLPIKLSADIIPSGKYKCYAGKYDTPTGEIKIFLEPFLYNNVWHYWVQFGTYNTDYDLLLNDVSSLDVLIDTFFSKGRRKKTSEVGPDGEVHVYHTTTKKSLKKSIEKTIETNDEAIDALDKYERTKGGRYWCFGSRMEKYDKYVK